MVQRVLIQGGQSSALRVSLPGFDVTTADLDQTCFDSRWSGLTPYLQGTIDSIADAAATVSFGEVLDVPPLMVGHIQLYLNGSPQAAFANTCFMLRGNGTDQWFYTLVGTSSLTFRGKLSSVMRLRYTLFKRPGG